MEWLENFPIQLLVVLGLVVVSFIKSLLEKAQSSRDLKQAEEEARQRGEPLPTEEDFDWYEEDSGGPPANPIPTAQPSPPAPPPVAPPSQPEFPRTLAELFGEPAAPPIAEDPPPIKVFEPVQAPQLTAAEQAALERVEKRRKGRRRKIPNRQELLELPEREFLRLQLRSPRSARNAIALTEVLSPPLALRQGGLPPTES